MRALLRAPPPPPLVPASCSCFFFFLFFFFFFLFPSPRTSQSRAVSFRAPVTAGDLVSAPHTRTAPFPRRHRKHKARSRRSGLRPGTKSTGRIPRDRRELPARACPRMASKSTGFFTGYLVLIHMFFHLSTFFIYHSGAFPTPGERDVDRAVYNRQLSEERPLQEQIAEADSATKANPNNKSESESAEPTTEPDSNFTALKSLAERAKDTASEGTSAGASDVLSFTEDVDSTKSRRLAEDYDSTKSAMDHKYKDDPDSFQQIDGTPLTADDIVQKIANKIYEEDDRGVFDRIVSKLLKLGLITESQADTLEYEVAEALQDLITKNARNNEAEDISMDYTISRDSDHEQNPDMNMETTEKPGRKDKVEAEQEHDDTVDGVWTPHKEADQSNQLSSIDGLEDLQYFPNFYNLLKSLNTEKDAEERETLITIMKTLIDFVKMMVKYSTITPEEGVSYLENLDAMIAQHTKKKLGKSLTTSSKPFTEKSSEEVDNTKEAASRMQKEYELLKDSTKDNQAVVETRHSGKSETYLEAIRKNIEWLKKQNKGGSKEGEQ
uniref:Secretogranin-3 n=1 Tax=Scleropages formosus TaxID=113540 RepID=A0A8C9ST28_SCLFO